MDKKNVLIISYYFAPQNTSAVYRILRFSKYLPENGWIPHILTVHESDAMMKHIDRDLLKFVTPFVHVYRTFSINLQVLIKRLFSSLDSSKQSSQKTFSHSIFKKALSKIKEHLSLRMFLFPDSRILWLFFALPTVYRLIKRKDIKIIFATASPWTDFLL